MKADIKMLSVLTAQYRHEIPFQIFYCAMILEGVLYMKERPETRGHAIAGIWLEALVIYKSQKI